MITLSKKENEEIQRKRLKSKTFRNIKGYYDTNIISIQKLLPMDRSEQSCSKLSNAKFDTILKSQTPDITRS